MFWKIEIIKMINVAYNYDLNTKKICYQDHDVHKMISTDVRIIYYIKLKLLLLIINWHGLKKTYKQLIQLVIM